MPGLQTMLEPRHETCYIRQALMYHKVSNDKYRKRFNEIFYKKDTITKYRNVLLSRKTYKALEKLVKVLPADYERVLNEKR